MNELGCPPTWVTNDVTVCSSEAVWFRLVEVIISGTLDDIVVDRSMEEPSFP